MRFDIFTCHFTERHMPCTLAGFCIGCSYLSIDKELTLLLQHVSRKGCSSISDAWSVICEQLQNLPCLQHHIAMTCQAL